MSRREVAVVGGGLAGEATALAIAQAGFDTVLIARSAPADARSTALVGASVAFLRDLGVMQALGDKAAPLSVMRLIDDTGRLFRAPTVTFRASEIDLFAFGYNVLNTDLAAAFADAIARTPKLERHEANATGYRIEKDRAAIECDDGTTFRVALAVGADGRRSVMRDAAGIATTTRAYPQAALVLNFEHSVPHGGVSTEFHTRNGPFTQVPLPGRRSSLVWVDEPKLADLYIDLKSDRLGRVIEDKMHSILGAVTPQEGIQRFPLSTTTVARVVGERLALVGEAAHAVPPIGAQGLNLGLRDGEALARLVSQSRDDPGRAGTMARYASARLLDIRSRSRGVDLLNRSLLADILPFQAMRSIGLGTLGAVPVLRQFAMREGLSPGAGFTGLPSAVLEGIGGNEPRQERE